MQIPEDATLLRIFCGEDDRCGSRPLDEGIVRKAREQPLRRTGNARAGSHAVSPLQPWSPRFVDARTPPAPWGA